MAAAFAAVVRAKRDWPSKLRQPEIVRMWVDEAVTLGVDAATARRWEFGERCQEHADLDHFISCSHRDHIPDNPLELPGLEIAKTLVAYYLNEVYNNELRDFRSCYRRGCTCRRL
ncbi:hypothetical protein HK405_005372 [Cladochytrium tenue]|nr:hypothetical protein HK405_005372 [Cladochytrium tenue]